MAVEPEFHITNVGETIPLYYGEGPDRIQIGTAVVNADGTVSATVDAMVDHPIELSGLFNESFSFPVPE
jgi:hypothetical protein